MTQNASKQGKFDSLGAIFFVHIFALYVGVGVLNDSPTIVKHLIVFRACEQLHT